MVRKGSWMSILSPNFLGRIFFTVVFGTTLCLSGCGQKDQPAGKTGEATPAQETGVAATTSGDMQSQLKAATGDPVSAVKVFLEAVRTGEDEKVVSLFSNLAREQAGQLNRQFAPVGSDTARYEVLNDVEYLAADGARVKSRWTDLDSQGQARTDEITWMLRKEEDGWRIAGMATIVFEGEPPLLLDFENLQETLRKVEMLSEEIERRQQQQQQENATHSPSAQDASRENRTVSSTPNENSTAGNQAKPLPTAPERSEPPTATALRSNDATEWR